MRKILLMLLAMASLHTYAQHDSTKTKHFRITEISLSSAINSDSYDYLHPGNFNKELSVVPDSTGNYAPRYNQNIRNISSVGTLIENQRKNKFYLIKLNYISSLYTSELYDDSLYNSATESVSSDYITEERHSTLELELGRRFKSESCEISRFAGYTELSVSVPIFSLAKRSAQLKNYYDKIEDGEESFDNIKAWEDQIFSNVTIDNLYAKFNGRLGAQVMLLGMNKNFKLWFYGEMGASLGIHYRRSYNEKYGTSASGNIFLHTAEVNSGIRMSF